MYDRSIDIRVKTRNDGRSIADTQRQVAEYVRRAYGLLDDDEVKVRTKSGDRVATATITLVGDLYHGEVRRGTRGSIVQDGLGFGAAR